MLSSMITQIQSFFSPWLLFLAEDPALRLLQSGMLLVGIVVIFLVFFTTRDILLRTHSFWYMFFSIVIVAALPIAGFFLYLLIRPSRTLADREADQLLTELLLEVRSPKRRQPEEKKGGIKKSKKNESQKSNLSL